MTITWLGHSCMKISENGYSVICDPYAPAFPIGFEKLEETADEVICSHEHDDHNYRDGVKLVSSGAPAFEFKFVNTFHDNKRGLLRGKNKICVMKTPSGLVAAHLGDLGHIPSEKQLEEIGKVDVLMIPVGGHYTIDAQTAKKVCDLLSPCVIIPMHYRGEGFGFDVLGTVEDFAKLFDKDEVTYLPSRLLEIDGKTSGVQIFKF